MEQYKTNKKIRFVKVLKGSKKPFEKKWTEKGYSWYEIRPWFLSGNNFGVLCGPGDLIVIDSDEPELADAVDRNLPDTFRVRTGGGGTHDYFFCPEIKKKIILQTEKHWGEVQSYGTQVIAAGSVHPNGKKYEVIKDIPILTITQADLIKAIKPFMREVSAGENNAKEELRDYGEADINNIKILDVLKQSNLKRQGNEFYGENPWHGSTGGMNFWVNPSKNVAHCFRCATGLNVAKVIALNNGLINDCADRLSKDDFKKVLDIAHRKYNLPAKSVAKKLGNKIVSAYGWRERAYSFIKEQPIYYDKSKIWWVWSHDKYKWEMTDETEILNFVSNNTGANTISTREKNEIIESLKQVGRENQPKEAPSDWIQFADTIVDIKTGERIKATPDYFITNPLPWEIGESEKTPEMDRIFSEWVGKENNTLLYEILSYCILPNYPLHRIFCFVGGGMNGKSKFLELINRFTGIENVASTDLDILLQSKFEVSKLYKKLVCQMGETNFSELSKTAWLKRLSGQDLVGFEYKNKNPFQGYNYAKILIATNNLPTTTDKTPGFYRRWIIIDFPNVFSEKKDILAEIPEIEYSNLALKCIRVLRELLVKRSFTNEGTLEERAKKYEEKSNPFDKFFKDSVKEAAMDEYIHKYELKNRLNDWCVTHRFRKLTDSDIRRSMNEKGIEEGRPFSPWYREDGSIGKKQIRSWMGIKWKE